MTKEKDGPEGRSVAFFDFDGTLTKGDTLMPFLKFVVGAPKYYAKLILVSPVLVAYFAKLLRNDIAKQVLLKCYLSGYQTKELFELGQKFSEEVIPAMLHSPGMERLQWHQGQGHDCILVSASLDFYLSSWSEGEGFKSFICTSLQSDCQGHVSGKISGKNCYGMEKRKRIVEYLGEERCISTYAYGDTKSDIPMLDFADNSFFVTKRNVFLYKKRI